MAEDEESIALWRAAAAKATEARRSRAVWLGLGAVAKARRCVLNAQEAAQMAGKMGGQGGGQGGNQRASESGIQLAVVEAVRSDLEAAQSHFQDAAGEAAAAKAAALGAAALEAAALEAAESAADADSEATSIRATQETAAEPPAEPPAEAEAVVEAAAEAAAEAAVLGGESAFVHALSEASLAGRYLHKLEGEAAARRHRQSLAARDYEAALGHLEAATGHFRLAFPPLEADDLEAPELPFPSGLGSRPGSRAGSPSKSPMGSRSCSPLFASSPIRSPAGSPAKLLPWSRPGNPSGRPSGPAFIFSTLRRVDEAAAARAAAAEGCVTCLLFGNTSRRTVKWSLACKRQDEGRCLAAWFEKSSYY